MLSSIHPCRPMFFGVSAEQTTLKFGGIGDDTAQFAALSEMGAFDACTSRKIFGEKGAGMLA